MNRGAWIGIISLLLIILLVSCAVAQTTQRTFQDEFGRTTGRSSTDPRGNTTFYNERGQNTGRSTTDSHGNTTIYDEMGRMRGRVRER